MISRRKGGGLSKKGENGGKSEHVWFYILMVSGGDQDNVENDPGKVCSERGRRIMGGGGWKKNEVGASFNSCIRLQNGGLE